MFSKTCIAKKKKKSLLDQLKDASQTGNYDS